MKLEKQVVSLELAKQLKELGVEQDSSFWCYAVGSSSDLGDFDIVVRNSINELKLAKDVERVSAFTVAELGEMLPPLYISLLTKNYGWLCCPKEVAEERARFEDERIIRAETDADARAKMLIYLIENNLLDN